MEEDLLLWKGHLTKFGYTSFKEYQKEAIQSIQLGRDVIVMQPTGSGKSLCFQLPSLFDPKQIVVVVSPTISLINSQIEGLRNLNIDAIALGRPSGNDSYANYKRVFCNDGKTPQPALVYMTPEHFANHASFDLMKCTTKIKMIVLDEVHKMFDRNTEFRSSYEVFKRIKSDFADVLIMALTATLTESQFLSLCDDYLHNPVVIKGTVNRKNIKFHIKPYVAKKTKKQSGNESSLNDGMWDICA